MANGTYIAMSGSMASQQRLEIVANNIANANAPGFKEQRTTFSEFLVPTGSSRPVEKGFTAITDAVVDGSAGAFEQTGNPLDLAIDGEGWFMVQGPSGPLLTRAGALRMRVDGSVVDPAGNAVLGGDPQSPTPVRVRADGGAVSVGSDGSIEQDGAPVARLTIVNADPAKLQPAGTALYRADPADVTPVAAPAVMSGYLESSNVNAVRGMIELIEISNDYQSAQSVMHEYRELDEKILSASR